MYCLHQRGSTAWRSSPKAVRLPERLVLRVFGRINPNSSTSGVLSRLPHSSPPLSGGHGRGAAEMPGMGGRGREREGSRDAGDDGGCGGDGGSGGRL